MLPSRSRFDTLRLKGLVVPCTDDDVGFATDHFIQIVDDTFFLPRTCCKLRKAICATGDIDELRDPGAGTDGRLLPLLEINSRTTFLVRACTNRFDTPFKT